MDLCHPGETGLEFGDDQISANPGLLSHNQVRGELGDDVTVSDLVCRQCAVCRPVDGEGTKVGTADPQGKTRQRPNSSLGHLASEYRPSQARLRAEIGNFDHVVPLRRIDARPFPEGKLEILSERSEGTMG
jgi:hypothetical protein